MLAGRIEAFRRDSRLEVIVSTAVFWAIPAWATSYNDIYLFIKRYHDGQEGGEVELDTLSSLYDELALREKFGLQEVRMEYLLKLPFYFLEQLMEQGLQLAATYD
jgi:hypothetical protein